MCHSGGVVQGVVVMSGGLEMLSAGATAIAVTVSSGGTIDLAAVIHSGQTVTALSGPATTSVSIDGVSVLGGAMLNPGNVKVLSGGTLSLGPGAIVSSVTIASGGELIGSGAVVNDPFVYYPPSSSTIDGLIDGVSIGTSDGDPGTVIIRTGGSAVDVAVVAGLLQVNAGATATGTTVSAAPYSQATLDLYGSAVGTVLTDDGQLIVESGGVTTGTQVNGFSTEGIYSGGVANDSVIGLFGTQVVLSGGTASGTVVSSGGTEILSAGARAAAVTVSSGGALGMTALISGGQALVVPQILQLAGSPSMVSPS